MITPVTTPATDLARAPSAADGAGVSKQKAPSFADDLASIMSETDAADETTPTPGKTLIAPPARPEKPGTPSAHPTFHPIHERAVTAANTTSEASNDDPADLAKAEKSGIEKMASASVSQNGKEATAEMPQTERINQDNSKNADSTQDVKAIPASPIGLTSPVLIAPPPLPIIAQNHPSSSQPSAVNAAASPTKTGSARPSSASLVATVESVTDSATGQDSSIDPTAGAFVSKQASATIAGQANAAKEGSQASKHAEAANSASAEQEKNTTSSDALTLPLDMQPLSNGLLGTEALTPKKPLAIDTSGVLASHQGPAPSNSGPIPYGMLPIEIGLGALQGRRAIEVRLSPDDLGTVEIRLEISDDSKISANITADRPATLAMMMNDAAKLRSALDQTGMTTTADTLQFSLKQDGNFTQNNGQHAEQRQNGQPQSQHRNASSPSTFQDAVPIASLRRAAGLLDVNI